MIQELSCPSPFLGKKFKASQFSVLLVSGTALSIVLINVSSNFSILTLIYDIYGGDIAKTFLSFDDISDHIQTITVETAFALNYDYSKQLVAIKPCCVFQKRIQNPEKHIAVNYFRKTLHLGCLTGFCIRLCLLGIYFHLS